MLVTLAASVKRSDGSLVAWYREAKVAYMLTELLTSRTDFPKKPAKKTSDISNDRESQQCDRSKGIPDNRWWVLTKNPYLRKIPIWA